MDVFTASLARHIYFMIRAIIKFSKLIFYTGVYFGRTNSPATGFVWYEAHRATASGALSWGIEKLDQAAA
jgi:hypothetical protein